MSSYICNNRLSSFDFFTKNGTNEDSTLNLLPPGGVASVAHELESTYSCSKDQTAKISADFFKSPIQTTFKKMIQCLCVSNVICRALKLISHIVTACWNRCFPATDGLNVESQVPEAASEDVCERVAPKAASEHDCMVILPDDIFFEIFSYLSLHELAVTMRVNSVWNEFLSKPICWQKAIYQEFAFSSKNWAQWDAEIVRGVNYSQEHLTLPKDVVEQLRLSYNAFPGKNIMQTHVLVRMPAGLSINKVGELAKKYFPNNDHGYRDILKDIRLSTFGSKTVEEPVWLLMTRNTLPESREKDYVKQQDIVQGLGQDLMGYAVPTTLEAVTCILAEYSKSNFNTRLFNETLRTFARCQEKIHGYQVFVSFLLDGVHVTHDYGRNGRLGIAPVRKFKGQ